MALPASRTLSPLLFPDKVRRFIDPKAPQAHQIMAAKGLVPVPPAVQIPMLSQLHLHGDEEVKRTALATVRSLPDSVLGGVVQRPLDPIVLDWLAHVFIDRVELVTALVQNRDADDETVAYVATSADEALTEIISHNQQRLLRSPPIIEALYFNEHTRMATADRIIELAARNGIRIDRIPMFDDVVKAVFDGKATGPDASSGTQPPLPEPTLPQPPLSATDLAAPTAKLATLDDANKELEKQLGDNAAARIRNLNVAQKVRLAMVGNKTERGLLIRDTNKIVSRAVIRSPRVSEPEVAEFAGNKSLDKEVISFIAQNRDWTRTYAIRLSLVYNPKTPLPQAVTFLKTLRKSDQRLVSRSKNVPAVLARFARQFANQTK